MLLQCLDTPYSEQTHVDGACPLFPGARGQLGDGRHIRSRLRGTLIVCKRSPPCSRSLESGRMTGCAYPRLVHEQMEVQRGEPSNPRFRASGGSRFPHLNRVPCHQARYLLRVRDVNRKTKVD